MRKAVLPATLAACAWLAACSEGMGPELPRDAAQRVAWSVNDGGWPPAILRQSPAAPPLESYEASVEACYGQKAKLRIRYIVNDDNGDENGPSTFLGLSIPSAGLWKHPDGSVVGPGDCLQITVSVDADYLLAEFSPAGLEFNPDFPATLTVSYARAHGDLDGDDDVDEQDEELQNTELDVWRLPHDNDQWQALEASHLVSAKRFVTLLYSFSHYAVAH